MQKLENNQSGDYVPANIDSAFNQFRRLLWHSQQKIEKEKTLEAMKITLDPGRRKFTNIDAGNYFYFSYLPQLPAMIVGRVAHMNVLYILYLGRLFALLFFIFCVRWAIKLIPAGKWLLMAVALMPICLAQAGSYNADCVLYSLVFLGLALLLKASFNGGPLTINMQMLLLFAIFMVLGVLKVLYLPMVLLLFLIPKSRFRKNLHYYVITFSAVVLATVLAIAWLKISSSYTTPADPNAEGPQKVASLLHNPFLAMRIVLATMNYFPGLQYRMTIGVLGYADTILPQGVYTTYTLTILFLALFEGSAKLKFQIYQRVLLGMIAIVIFVGAFVALYLINPKQNGFVTTGVQGRYLVPALMCFLLALQGLVPLRINLSRHKILVFLLFLILFIALFATQMTILERYYG
jgi:uncharacterized membrane protein